MTERVSDKLRRLVAQRAGYRCEYCLLHEQFSATYFHIDHIRSVKHGGLTDSDNLAYACPHCNQHKGSDVGTFAADDETLIRFFNPRKDNWNDHFNAINGEVISGTPVGAATVSILQMNQSDRLLLRQALTLVGQYPG